MGDGLGKSFSYRDLEVWKLGIDLAEAVYRLTDSFPKSEEFGLKGQLRRASVSVSANIAEGWSYGSQAVLAKHVRIARASLSEVDSLAFLASRVGMLEEDQEKEISTQVDTLGRKTYAFLKKVEDTVVREDEVPYTQTPKE